jgi:hypothetical protein
MDSKGVIAELLETKSESSEAKTDKSLHFF